MVFEGFQWVLSGYMARVLCVLESFRGFTEFEEFDRVFRVSKGFRVLHGFRWCQMVLNGV